METGEHTAHQQQFADENQLSGYMLRGVDNRIHPTAIVGENVKLGKGNVIGPFCNITGNTEIGDNNYFEAYCAIGSEPEHKTYFGKPNQGVKIGNNNYFREFVTVNAGCEKPTIITNRVTMLRGSHVGHDSTVNDECTLSCNVVIGGHSLLGNMVNMGIGSICHQRSRIGSYSMIGMGTIITKKSKIECFKIYVGSPARDIGENTYLSIQFNDGFVEHAAEQFKKMQL